MLEISKNEDLRKCSGIHSELNLLKPYTITHLLTLFPFCLISTHICFLIVSSIYYRSFSFALIRINTRLVMVRKAVYQERTKKNNIHHNRYYFFADDNFV